jgi:hypothetical protein
MNLRTKEQTDPQRKAASQDVRRTLGSLDDGLIVEILGLRPTLRDLTEAALWLRGNGDLTARHLRDMSASAAAIIEILKREDEDMADEGR